MHYTLTITCIFLYNQQRPAGLPWYPCSYSTSLYFPVPYFLQILPTSFNDVLRLEISGDCSEVYQGVSSLERRQAAVLLNEKSYCCLLYKVLFDNKRKGTYFWFIVVLMATIVVVSCTYIIRNSWST